MTSEDRPAITRAEWEAHWRARFNALRNEYPEKDMQWAFLRAHEATREAHGPQPPKMRAHLLKLAWRYIRGEDMEWSWTKNLWKGAKGALASALTVALIFGADALIQSFDTHAELTALGVPLWAIPLVMALVAMARNYIKHRQRRIPIP